MRLCIDFGNTKVKLAVFDEDFQIYYLKSVDIGIDEVKNIINKYGVKSCIISSTRNLDTVFLQQLSEELHLVILDEHTVLPINNQYRSPKTLGKDRIAAAVGAKYHFPNDACVVIDAGTCITMDYVTAQGEYIGGNISPGIWMRRQAMHDFTDKLPLVEMSLPSDIIGFDTTSALQNGFLRGTLYEVESFIRSLSHKYGPNQVIITGGDIKYFEDRLNFQIFASSNLVLVGLNEILKLNDK